jgi:predicted MFS family arabinose efflux permease
VFKPWLGHAIDRLGERAILMGEAIILVGVCIGYGFSRSFFSAHTAFIVAAVCYIVDQLLMSASMARATYLKKIAVVPADVTATLTAATSLDHVFSITIALLGGLIWKTWGYEYIFLLGAVIALANLYCARQITRQFPQSCPNKSESMTKLI